MTTNHTQTPFELAVKNLDGQCSYAFSRGNKSLSIKLEEGREILRALRERDELAAALREIEEGNVMVKRNLYTVGEAIIEYQRIARAALAKLEQSK